MVEIIQDVFTEMASEYLLSNKEAEKSVDRLKDKLDGKLLKICLQVMIGRNLQEIF